MAKVYRLYAGIITALALCEYSTANWNITESVNKTETPCHRHGNGDNCTAPTLDTGEWNDHFSKCPEELHHYCIHGACRYIKDQKTPSCRCQSGYVGSRCEYIDLDWQIGERRQIIIISVIAALVLLIFLILFFFICSHRRSRLCRKKGRQTEESRNGTEKLHMMDTSGHTLAPDPVEPLNNNNDV
ncbi:probetacellulin isoform X1 [Nerophis ophidion]|uniref:probetacellulin isoform X1 n=1 Tax=Nerophis ophidion TaxID=159077 RepID=UPI002AE00E3E|nr:probetacellulin isoform X1 [Nerophis ophidion]